MKTRKENRERFVDDVRFEAYADEANVIHFEDQELGEENDEQQEHEAEAKSGS